MTESRYLLVRCEPELDESRIAGLYHAFVSYPGVKCVMDADLSGLPRDRLNVLTGVPYDPRERRPRKVKLG
jgi:hypothetical protein